MSMFVSGFGPGFRPFGILCSLIVCALFILALPNGAHASVPDHFSPSDLKNSSRQSSYSGAANITKFLSVTGHAQSAVKTGKLVRLAQANFDFTGFNESRARAKKAAPRRAVKNAPKIKVYRAPNKKVYRRQQAKPLFGFFEPKQVVRARPAPAFGGPGYYIVYGSDGRAYRVYPGGKKSRPSIWGQGKFGNQQASRPSGYRTMCVRTCDGFYFPVSNGTQRSRLRRDNNICESSCGVPAKLFYYSNAGGSVDTMVDLKGKKYSSMKFAYKYRKKSDNSCRCKEQPWAQSEIIRHEQYAADEKDRGLRRAKLVKVSHVKVASVKIDMTDSFRPEIYYNNGGNFTKTTSNNAPDSASEGSADADKVIAELVDGASDPEPGVVDGQADVLASVEPDAEAEGVTRENPHIRTVANSRTAIKRLRARRRYRVSAKRMKNWWRSNRY